MQKKARSMLKRLKINTVLSEIMRPTTLFSGFLHFWSAIILANHYILNILQSAKSCTDYVSSNLALFMGSCECRKLVAPSTCYFNKFIKYIQNVVISNFKALNYCLRKFYDVIRVSSFFCICMLWWQSINRQVQGKSSSNSSCFQRSQNASTSYR